MKGGSREVSADMDLVKGFETDGGSDADAGESC